MTDINKSKVKNRDSNFELMRIVSMFMIVFWHTIIYTPSLANGGKVLGLSLDMLLSILVVHVNSFVLLTGYFQCKTSFRTKKIFSLLGISWFYRIIALIIVLAFSLVSLTHLEFLNAISILPRGLDYWFIHPYILIYLFSPFLNKFINKITQKEFKDFLLILVLVNSILPYLSNQEFFSVGSGYSLYHFVTLYFLGAYMRLYPIDKSYHFSRMSKKQFRLFNIFIFFLCSFVSVAILGLGRYIVGISQGEGTILYDIGIFLQKHFMTYDFPLTILQSCAYFMFFGTFSFKNKFIDIISSSMIGVYFIHENRFLRPFFYQEFSKSIQSFSLLKALISIFGYAIFLFVSCILIELLRKQLFKMLKFLFQKWKGRKKEILLTNET